jgi:hypothetical protein
MNLRRPSDPTLAGQMETWWPVFEDHHRGHVLSPGLDWAGNLAPFASRNMITDYEARQFYGHLGAATTLERRGWVQWCDRDHNHVARALRITEDGSVELSRRAREQGADEARRRAEHADRMRAIAAARDAERATEKAAAARRSRMRVEAEDEARDAAMLAILRDTKGGDQ